MIFNKKENKRPFFSKRLLFFFLVMIFIVFSSFLFLRYLAELKEAYQSVFIHENMEGYSHPTGQELLVNQNKRLNLLAKEKIEVLVLSYGYSQTGRIGDKQIKEITYYIWLPSKEEAIQVNIDPDIILFDVPGDRLASIGESGNQQSEFSLVEQISQTLNTSLDFLFVLDLDELEEFLKVQPKTVLNEGIVANELSPRAISQALGKNLFDYQHFFSLSQALSKSDVQVKSNLSYYQFLELTLYYNFRQWEKYDVYNLDNSQRFKQRQEIINYLQNNL